MKAMEVGLIRHPPSFGHEDIMGQLAVYRDVLAHTAALVELTANTTTIVHVDLSSISSLVTAMLRKDHKMENGLDRIGSAHATLILARHPRIRRTRN